MEHLFELQTNFGKKMCHLFSDTVNWTLEWRERERKRARKRRIEIWYLLRMKSRRTRLSHCPSRESTILTNGPGNLLTIFREERETRTRITPSDWIHFNFPSLLAVIILSKDRQEFRPSPAFETSPIDRFHLFSLNCSRFSSFPFPMNTSTNANRAKVK